MAFEILSAWFQKMHFFRCDAGREVPIVSEECKGYPEVQRAAGV